MIKLLLPAGSRVRCMICMIYVGHVFCVGSVLHRSGTCHDGRVGPVDDLSDLDRDLSDLSVRRVEDDR